MKNRTLCSPDCGNSQVLLRHNILQLDIEFNGHFQDDGIIRIIQYPVFVAFSVSV